MEEMNINYEYEKTKDGNLLAKTIYGKRNVEIQFKGESLKIGEQQVYTISQIIDKKELKNLHLFLLNNRNELLKRNIQANEIIEKNKDIDVQELVENVNKLNQLIEKSKMKKDLIRITSNCKHVNMLRESIENVNIAKSQINYNDFALKNINKQIDFIEKNFSI